jgi:hypothetical protein
MLWTVPGTGHCAHLAACSKQIGLAYQACPNSPHAPQQWLIPAMFHNILNDHNSSLFFSSREKFLMFRIYQTKMRKICCAMFWLWNQKWKT